MSWQQYVDAAKALGFTKVTIIARANYQTLGRTSDADIATAWQDGDKQINENQELLDDWTDVKKNCFCFYGQKFNIILRDEDDGTFVVCFKGKIVCIAKQFKSIWFVVSGQTKKKGGKEKEAAGFASAPDAFTKISNAVWDPLEENNV